MRSGKGILALVLTVALLAGCGRAAPAPVQQTPAPVSGSEAAPVGCRGCSPVPTSSTAARRTSSCAMLRP